jgi:Glyoxalase-like domain
MAPADGPAVRLRQAVLVAAELEPLVARLREELGLGEPFRDPGVGEFGLANAVFAIGDCFLEIVSPTGPGTAAGRQLERAGGDGGYMVLFDLEDLDGARGRAEREGVRTVWRIDLPDISGTHMHPADLRGAIVSLDGSRPYGTWRWGGPEWTGRTGSGAAGRLDGIAVAVRDPDQVAARWGAVLGLPVERGGSAPTLAMSDGAGVSFVAAGADGVEQIVEISLSVPPDVRAGNDGVDVGAARLALADLG